MTPRQRTNAALTGFVLDMDSAPHIIRAIEQAITAAVETAEAESERRRLLLEKSDARVNRLSERLGELEAQLAAANARAKVQDAGRFFQRALAAANARAKECQALTVAAQTASFDKWEQADKLVIVANARAEKAEADAARLRDVLTKVEAWFASEHGPIYRLWEDTDICNYDNRECEWEEALAEVRDFTIPADCVGYGTEWPAVTLYREILMAMRPAGHSIRCAGYRGSTQPWDETACNCGLRPAEQPELTAHELITSVYTERDAARADAARLRVAVNVLLIAMQTKDPKARITAITEAHEALRRAEQPAESDSAHEEEEK